MRPVRQILAAALVFSLCAIPVVGLSQWGNLMPKPTSGVTFTGIGDVVASAKGHWGTIAYSAASRGSNMLKICDNAGANCIDIASGATTGIVSSTQTVNGNTCTGSFSGTTYTAGAHPCLVTTMYDDSGGSNCTGACNLTQATVAFMPAFVPNFVGTVPAIYGNSFNGFIAKSSGFTAITLPITMGIATATITNGGGTDRVFTIADGAGVIIANRVSGNGTIYNGAFMDTGSTMTAGTMYALIGDIATSGASGGMSINGSRTTGSPSTQNSGSGVGIGSDVGGANACNCVFMEAFVYASQVSTGNITSINSKMRTNGGY